MKAFNDNASLPGKARHLLQRRVDLGRGIAVTIEFDPETGIVVLEKHRYNGKTHRVAGPAFIYRDPVSGNVVREIYYRGGMLHRSDGPALIDYDPRSGNIVATSYAIWDHVFANEQDWRRARTNRGGNRLSTSECMAQARQVASKAKSAAAKRVPYVKL